ncbi:hypothetical protein CVT26_003314 [Gymnopilus dilepis]|uniref:Uncharacterized protein n=1 Tax=Gymnopilus dilepis TaxID=231916 RepID=A0A409W2S6_9AGAR|nr:hypothetical protein CVT26_003314 [Gymnopilus dilepis]
MDRVEAQGADHRPGEALNSEPVAEKVSVLGAAGGTVHVQGGQFNATAGHHISVAINTPTIERRPFDSGSPEAPHAPPTNQSPDDRDRSPSSTLQRSCDIYYRHIGAKGRGSPLWIPGPNRNLHVDYRRSGIAIGDVGILTADGRFDFLFNICLPHDHPINPPVMPDCFVTLDLPPHDIQHYSEFGQECYLASSSIRKSHRESDAPGLVFESSASEGAILAMPAGSNSAQLANIRLFRKYASTHAENWYRYANDTRGREARNGDVRLVTGYDKTSQWGMATFSNSSAGSEDPLFLKFRPLEQDVTDPVKTYGWEYSGMAEVRAGPDRREIEDLRRQDPGDEPTEYENQCLFVRTLNVTLRQDIWKRLAVELGGVEIDSDDGDLTQLLPPYSTSSATASSNASGSHLSSRVDEKRGAANALALAHLPGIATVWHPSAGLHELIHQGVPHARMVITDDSDWIAALRELNSVQPSPVRKQRMEQRLLVVPAPIMSAAQLAPKLPSELPWPPLPESRLPALADAFVGYEEIMKEKKARAMTKAKILSRAPFTQSIIPSAPKDEELVMKVEDSYEFIGASSNNSKVSTAMDISLDGSNC